MITKLAFQFHVEVITPVAPKVALELLLATTVFHKTAYHYIRLKVCKHEKTILILLVELELVYTPYRPAEY